MTDNDLLLGRNLGRLVDLRLASRRSLAEAAGVSVQAIGQLIRGDSKGLKPGNLVRIASTTGFQVTTLVREDLSKLSREDLEALQRANPTSRLLSARLTGADDDSIDIPQLEVQGAMGDGSYPPDHIDVIQYVKARISELRKQCAFSDPEKLQIITGYGRSMLPTFSDGDPLLVDSAVKSADIDAVYAFTFDGKFYIKGLQRMRSDGLKVISHNKAENEPWDIKANEMDLLTIHGRVILAWNARRL